MADYIISPWRITFGATILLDYGNRMLAEPVLNQPHESELVSFARALNPVGFHYGNVGHYLNFSRAVDHATVSDARDSVLAHMVVTGALRVGTLTIEVQGGASYQLLNAVLQDVTPEMGPELGARANRVLWNYSLAGGKLLPLATSNNFMKFTAYNTQAGSFDVKLSINGADGATGVYYTVNGGVPVFVPVSAVTFTTLNIAALVNVDQDVVMWAGNQTSTAPLGAIKWVEIKYENITKFDCSDMKELEKLFIMSNLNIVEFDPSGCTSLLNIIIGDLSVSSLDISGCVALNFIEVDSSLNLTSISAVGARLNSVFGGRNNGLTRTAMTTDAIYSFIEDLDTAGSDHPHVFKVYNSPCTDNTQLLDGVIHTAAETLALATSKNIIFQYTV